MLAANGLQNSTITSEILQWAPGMALAGSPKATTDCTRAFSAFVSKHRLNTDLLAFVGR